MQFDLNGSYYFDQYGQKIYFQPDQLPQLQSPQLQPPFYQQPLFYQQPSQYYQQQRLDKRFEQPLVAPPKKILSIKPPPPSIPPPKLVNPNTERLKYASSERVLSRTLSSDQSKLPSKIANRSMTSPIDLATEDEFVDEFVDEFNLQPIVHRSRVKKKLIFDSAQQLIEEFQQLHANVAERQVNEAGPVAVEQVQRSVIFLTKYKLDQSKFNIDIFNWLTEKGYEFGTNNDIIQNIFTKLNQLNVEKNPINKLAIAQPLVELLNRRGLRILSSEIVEFTDDVKTPGQIAEFLQKKERIINGLRDRTVVSSSPLPIPFITSNETEDGVIKNIIDGKKLINNLNFNINNENISVDNYINTVGGQTTISLGPLGNLKFQFKRDDKKLEQMLYKIRFNWNFTPNESNILFINAKRNCKFDSIHASVYFNKFFKKNTYNELVNFLKMHITCTIIFRGEQYELHYGRSDQNEYGTGDISIWTDGNLRKKEIIDSFPDLIIYLKEIYERTCDQFGLDAKTHFGKKKNKFKQICMDINYLKKLKST